MATAAAEVSVVLALLVNLLRVAVAVAVEVVPRLKAAALVETVVARTISKGPVAVAQPVILGMAVRAGVQPQMEHWTQLLTDLAVAVRVVI